VSQFSYCIGGFLAEGVLLFSFLGFPSTFSVGLMRFGFFLLSTKFLPFLGYIPCLRGPSLTRCGRLFVH
jgi:hypothetical protein